MACFGELAAGSERRGGGGSAGRLGQRRPPLFVIRPRIGGPGGLQRSPSAGMGQRGAKAGPCHRNSSSFFYGNPHVLAVPPRHGTAAGKKPRKGRRMLPVDAGLPRSSGKIFFAGRTKRRHNEGPFEKGKPLEEVRCDGSPRRMRTGRRNPNPGVRGPFQASSLSSEPFLW